LRETTVGLFQFYFMLCEPLKSRSYQREMKYRLTDEHSTARRLLLSSVHTTIILGCDCINFRNSANNYI